MASRLIEKYMRGAYLPHIWCAGCGNGIILRDVVQAVENLGIERRDTIIVSGIGCSSRAVGYLDFDTLHTTHGRAIAFATGIKMARPELKVIVLTGDGDAAAIGGNHLIHAARRNIDITVVVFNNNTYGMMGGQFSPTTPTGDIARPAPHPMAASTRILTSSPLRRRRERPTRPEAQPTMSPRPQISSKRPYATRAFPWWSA